MNQIENSRLNEIMRISPHWGSFKPTAKVAKELGMKSVDFYDFRIFGEKYVKNGQAYGLWEKSFNEKSENKNAVIVKTYQDDLEPFAASLVRFVNPDYGIQHVVSVVASPRAFNSNPSYSYDVRMGRGTSHFALDFLLSKQDYSETKKILDSNPWAIIPALRHVRAKVYGNEKVGNRDVDLYGGWDLGNTERPYEVERIN